MRPIAAGKYRHIIDIQSKVAALDEWGGDTFEWVDVAADVRARKWPIKGRELIAAQAAQSETTDRFYIRYRDGLDSSMRIVYKSKYYDITSIIDIEERQRELEISTKTGMSEG